MDSKTRYETPDQTPVDVPFGFSYESLADTIGRMVRVENQRSEQKKRYVESFAESQDFDEDTDEFKSPHELTDLQEEMPADWLTEAPPEPARAPEAADEVRADPTPPAAAEGSPPVLKRRASDE